MKLSCPHFRFGDNFGMKLGCPHIRLGDKLRLEDKDGRQRVVQICAHVEHPLVRVVVSVWSFLLCSGLFTQSRHQTHIEMVLRVSSSKVRGQVNTKSVNRKTEMKNSLLVGGSKDLKRWRSAVRTTVVVRACSVVASPIGFAASVLFRACSEECRFLFFCIRTWRNSASDRSTRTCDIHRSILSFVFWSHLFFTVFCVDILILRPSWVVREVRFHVRKYNIVVSVLESDAPRKPVSQDLPWLQWLLKVLSWVHEFVCV